MTIRDEPVLGPMSDGSRPAPDDGALLALIDAACEGRRGPLGRLLSILENRPAAARRMAKLLQGCPRGASRSVGITGLPGAGKSTIVSQLAGVARREAERVAVLAIDPSSPYSGGALLGDRVRMDAHVGDESVFIRSIATRGEMGGLARVVPQALDLLDVVGYQMVLVETVGVGQVEVDIVDEVDTTVVVLNPGWGDWLQVNKAGLLEVADILVMNKADRPQVKEAVRDLERMLDDSDTGPWRPPVVTTIGTSGEGIDELWAQVTEHWTFLEREELLNARRRERQVRRLRRKVQMRVAQAVQQRFTVPDFRDIEERVMLRQLDDEEAVDLLFEHVVRGLGSN